MINLSYTTNDICTICDGEHYGNTQAINHILYDSRAQQKFTNALFIALIGARQNGHKFISQAFSKGIRSFLISEKTSIDASLQDATFILVEDTLKALQLLAKHHRERFELEVIGVTGSNGKTVTKEWLFQLLKEQCPICRSPKSYNSQIGVPISIWNLNHSHNLAIFEAGISHPNEMQKLASMIQPSIGLFTNIGFAHAQNFENQEAIIQEKLTLFYQCKTLIYCKDHKQIQQAIENCSQLDSVTKINWSRKGSADLEIKSCEAANGNTSITGRYKNETVKISIPFNDDASIENAIHCWLICLLLDTPREIITKGMLQLSPIAMRLELKKGINGCTLINDTYNSDVTSLKIAITYLKQQQQHPKHTIIISDILQNNVRIEEVYKEVADLVKRNQIDRIIAIGSEITAYKSLFPIPLECYETTAEFINQIDNQSFSNEAILIKGARLFEFEKVTERLQEKAHTTRLEINLNSLIDNFNYYKSILKPETKLMIMVKAFSYGSGTHEIANILEYYRADYLAVAYTDEGISLRKQGITLPIMVLNPEPSSFDSLIRFGLEAEIFSIRLLRSFLEHINSANHTNDFYKIHIKLDTGMRRLGFELSEMKEVVELLKDEKRVKIESIFSHLAASDDDEKDDFTEKQFELFDEMDRYLKHHLKTSYNRHILNSSGILRFPDKQFEMVRLGIGLYGVSNTEIHKKHLSPVHRLVAHISQIKQVNEGETVGYGRRGIMPKDGKIATISIGYADGISRHLGNGKWKVEINGALVPTIGSICMDMLMVNITDISATEGDEVIIFGPNNSIYDLAKAQETIPYEILTDVGGRVKRVFYLE